MHSPGAQYVVVGGGPAAASAAQVLAENAPPEARVLVLTGEPTPPYDRTTLSKAALVEALHEPPALWPADATWLPRIDVQLATTVEAIDTAARTVRTQDGAELPYAALLLATGAEPRRLTLPGIDGPGVHYLRDSADARALSRDLRAAAASGGAVVVIGGGVIGLEVAASAQTIGCVVHVVEVGPRILGRGVPAAVAGWILARHRENGVQVTTGAMPTAVIREGDQLRGLELAGGVVLPADVLVVGVGVVPRDELARAAGLEVDDGILVDSSGRTSDAFVFAAGDGARMRSGPGERGVRLESYQPAGRQGQVAALAMLGSDTTYTEATWAWSDQYDVTMQSAGLAPADAEEVTCGDEDAVLVLSFFDDRLVAGCGVARLDRLAEIARPIRAVQLLLGGGHLVNRRMIEPARADLVGLGKILRTAAGPDRT